VGVMRPIGHEERLSIVDHLDELRTRLIACVALFVIAFAVCYSQNDKILEWINKPLENSQKSSSGNDPLEQAAAFDVALEQLLIKLKPALSDTSGALSDLGDEPGVSSDTRASVDQASAALTAAAKELTDTIAAVPEDHGRRPVTLGVAEPFTTTFTVAGYAALLLVLPFILWQAYAFVLPAFDARERRVALPLMLMVPVLFVTGVAFAYWVALPRAVDFLQNFNDDQFDILIQARDYYRFVIVFLALMGLVFQIPVGVLALTRTGLVTARGLWKHQGYVILGISIVAAVATPTPDPVTMLVTMMPLVLLYWLSIGLAWVFRLRGDSGRGRWDALWDDEDEDDEDAGDGDDTPDGGPGQDAAADAAVDPARVS
jgi:sec-independent protein translocase protein TatC